MNVVAVCLGAERPITDIVRSGSRHHASEATQDRARKSKVPPVLVAEQWQRGDEGQVVVFVEGPPSPHAL